MTRRGGVIVAALVTVGLVVPAGANAQAIWDEAQCREAGHPRSLCVGVAKLGERASAECRRLGIVDDETCWSRVGRRVVRAEVAAYEDSWLHRTLAFQRSLGDALPFRDAPWLGTHNSFNSTDELPTVSHTDSNQQLSLTDQLRLDMRSLEVDVHWLPSIWAGGATAPVVCHGQGAVGCTVERLLSDRLFEVAGWLRANPGEVLLLYLEDQIDDPAGYVAAAKNVQDILGDRLYRPTGGCQNLPLDLSRQAVRAGQKQVVIVGDCGQGAWQGISFAWPTGGENPIRFEERPHSFQPYPSCGGVPRATWQSRLMRFYEDSTWLTATAGEPDDGLTPATTRELVRCGVDVLGFDQLLPGDGRLAAAAWSWAPGEPGAGTCAIQRADGRWESRSCAEPHPPACVAADGTWTVLAEPVAQAAAAAACATAGLVHATPRTGYENQLLDDAHASTAWIAFRQASSGLRRRASRCSRPRRPAARARSRPRCSARARSRAGRASG